MLVEHGAQPDDVCVHCGAPKSCGMSCQRCRDAADEARAERLAEEAEYEPERWDGLE